MPSASCDASTARADEPAVDALRLPSGSFAPLRRVAPERPFVERRPREEEPAPQQVEEQPARSHPEGRGRHAAGALESTRPGSGARGAREARGAQDPTFMLGDALAAERARAAETARR